jgi:hypothetical protein
MSVQKENLKPYQYTESQNYKGPVLQDTNIYILLYNCVLWRCFHKSQNETCSYWENQKNAITKDIKKTAYLPIIIATRKYGWMEKFLKTVPQALHSIRKSFLQGQSIITENSVVAGQCPLSTKWVCTDF